MYLFFESVYKNGKKFIKLVILKNEKLHQHKEPTSIKNVGIDKK